MSAPLGIGTALRPAELLPASAPEGKGNLAEAARQFEGMLMQSLLQAMRKTVEPSGLFGNEAGARSTYEYLFDQAVVEGAMKSGKGWGLAKRLEEAWTARQNSEAFPVPKA